MVLAGGEFKRVALDSYLPTLNGQPLFTAPYQSAILPCLLEKLVAKVSGGYSNIP